MLIQKQCSSLDSFSSSNRIQLCPSVFPTIFYSLQVVSLFLLGIREKLIHNGTKIEILWILSHIGIFGNEKADQAAKDAIINSSIDTFTATHLEDLRKSIKGKPIANWEHEWNNIATPHIKNLTANSTQTPTESTKLPRIEQVAITKIKTGQTKITHEHLLVKEPATSVKRPAELTT